MKLFKVKEVCRKCQCTEWNTNDRGVLVCSHCGSIKCSVNKWFLPCEPKELEIKNGKEFFVGDLSEHF